MKHKEANIAGLVVLAEDGEPRASTLAIAVGMHQDHASVIKLVRRHHADLEVFGRVGFEIQPFKTRGGMQSREIAMLNEHQSTLLISLMKNSASVVAFKIGMVKEFYRMRAELQRRENGLWQQMQALIAKEVDSQVRASFGSHLMLKRKAEIPALRDERQLLENAIQPSLLN